MKQAQNIVSIMFLSREQAHRAHLKTKIYAQHMALGDFYESIIEIADEFAETFIGLHESIGDIPHRLPMKGEIDDVLESHLATIEAERTALDADGDKPLQNIIDTACGLYGRTLYKLRNLS